MLSDGKQMIRAGVLGAGNVVESLHLPVLRSLDGVKIAWVCDKDAARGRALASAYDIPHAFGSLDDCFDVDVVLVAIPVGARRVALEKILARGWHAFCEKPFAPTLQDHEWIVAEARRRKVRLGIGLVRRHYTSVKMARELLGSGVLGPLKMILGGEGARVRQTGRGGDWYQASGQASGGGVLFETGSHLVDQVFTICQVQDFEIDHCSQKVLNGIEFETSAGGTLIVGGGRPVPFQIVVSHLNDVYNGIVLRCQNGELRLGAVANGTTDIYGRDGRITARLGRSSSEGEAFIVAVRAEWQEFVDSCARSVEFCDWETGLLTTAFIEACYRFNVHARAERVSEITV
jgi:predicted dehydrogenase